jgi:carbamoyltransferase
MGYILGIACNGTDSSACLFKKGKLLCAVEEERFTRVRHDGGIPMNAISYCLEFDYIKPHQIERVTVSWDYPRYDLDKWNTSSINNFYKSLEFEGYSLDWNAVADHTSKFNCKRLINRLKLGFSEIENVPISFFNHHDCHAASSYCFSGFDSSLILVLDEKGEDNCTSLYLGKKNIITMLEQTKVPHSLGLYYAAATQFLNFVPYRDEGTFMALATMGRCNRLLKSWILTNVLNISNGKIRLNPEMISNKIFNYIRYPGFLYTNKMLAELSELGIIRPKKIESIEPIHWDFAYTIQDVFESIIIAFLKEKLEKYRVNNICISGGVGLNCTLNGKICTTNNKIKGLFVPPWCHDAGGAIGAAILSLQRNNNVRQEKCVPIFERLTRADWGPEYSDAEIEAALRGNGLDYLTSQDISLDAARLLAEGMIIGWFQGRAEFGPRALGQRSLLSHPGIRDNKERLQAIKQRFPFRPLSPSVLGEFSQNYFVKNGESTDFMSIAFNASDSAQRVIPYAINMTDKTLRAQTVNNRDGWTYRRLLEYFYMLTGIPALLNTSFNVNEPLVLTPEDAIKTFINNAVDALAIGSFLIIKRDLNRGERI